MFFTTDELGISKVRRLGIESIKEELFNFCRASIRRRQWSRYRHASSSAGFIFP